LKLRRSLRKIKNLMPSNQAQQNIPKGWKVTKLGDIVSVTTGSRDANHGSSDGAYPFFTCAQKVSKIDDYSFDTEAVLIAGNGDFNVKYYKGKFDAYQRTYVLSDFEGTTGNFIYHKAKQALGNIVRNNQGSSVKFIKKGDLTDYELFLPPVEEQQKIADVLGAVDEEIEKTKEVIKATEKLKKGLMQQLFSEGEIVKLEDIAEVSTGKTPNRSNKKSYENGSVPWVKSTEVRFGVIKDTSEKITEEAVESENMRVIPKNSVLVAMYGQGITRGKSAILGCDATTNQAIAAITPDHEKLSTTYLFYWLMSQYENLRNLGHGGNQKNLNSRIIKSLNVPVCAPRRQKEISEILLAVDEKIAVNKKILAKQTKLKKGLMQDLLSGVKRVKI